LKKNKIKKMNLPSSYTLVDERELTINGEVGWVALILFGLAAGCKVVASILRDGEE